jgi:hypothetical protein
MCPSLAISTLTYVYADCTVVLGPLATFPEPHCYDLCAMHSAKMVAPSGWDLVRLGATAASAVNETIPLPTVPAAPAARTSHLRVVPDNS